MGLPKKTQINAILGEEFNKLLDRLGVREDFEAGKYHCHVCGDQVGENNVLIVFPLSENEVGFVCKNPKCVIKHDLALKR